MKDFKNMNHYLFKLSLNGTSLQSTDDMFEVEIQLTEEEHDRILTAFSRFFWDDVDRVDLFSDYLPAMKEKICALAEPYAVEKWGDKAKLENGAWYDVFPPETIMEEYYASDQYRYLVDNSEETR